MHEVQRPDMVRHRRRNEWLLGKFGQSFPSASRHVELHLFVNSPDTLVVPGVSLVSEPIEAQSKPPAPVLGNDGVEHINHWLRISRESDRCFTKA